MKIIEEKKWSKQITCNCCTTVLEIYQEDIRSSSYEDGKEYYVTCPSCTNEINLKNLPWTIQLNAKKK